jgi:hypothetical protein
MSRRSTRPIALVALLAALWLTTACRRERLSMADCRQVLDRITDLELAERGFRDPVLAARKKAQLQGELAAEVASCAGRRVRPGAMDCVRRAASSEELSHRCLR